MPRQASSSRQSTRHPFRREQILRVAVEIFHQNGVGSTNVEAIASAVGLRPASLYHHFRDKQAIIDAAVDAASAQLVARIEKRARADGESAEPMEALIDDLADFVLGDTALAAVGRYDRVLASPSVRRRAERTDELLLQLLSSTIGSARPDLGEGDRRARAQCILGVIWSVTHFDLRLGPAAMRRYFRSAAKAAALGTQDGGPR